MRMVAAALLLAFTAPAAAGDFACPAELSGGGSATWYDIGAANACGLDPGDGMTAAVASSMWDGSARCGECLQIDGPDGSVRVRITDVCPDCPFDLDLSRQAFDAIADPSDGIAPVSWRRVACPVAGNLAFRFEGSNPWYYKIQARNHPHGIAAMAFFDGSTYTPMTRTNDNHFTGSPVNVGDVRVHVTATTGETLTQHIGPIVNGVDIPGDDQFASCDDVLFRDGFQSP
jgi:expansin (peptidoglycan-binding protein)